jgi:hypothetical protein
MDRLAAHVVATAVLTAALAAIPTAMAQPAAKTSASPSSASAPATPSSLPSPSASVPASPAPPPGSKADVRRPRRYHRGSDAVTFVCPDAYQVGPTAYARWHGAIAFSVKQFYSPKCHARYGYAHPWLRFRQLRVDYDLGISEFDMTHDAIDGARTFVGRSGGPFFWSDALNVPAGTCTEGLAHVFFPDDETDTYSEKFCA